MSDNGLVTSKVLAYMESLSPAARSLILRAMQNAGARGDEILESVATLIRDTLIPQLPAGAVFQARVAANAVDLVRHTRPGNDGYLLVALLYWRWGGWEWPSASCWLMIMLSSGRG